MDKTVRVLVVGLRYMALSHAKAYDKLEGFELAGLCARSIKADWPPAPWSQLPRFANYGEVLTTIQPDDVSINTFADTHADFAIRAFEAGALSSSIASAIATYRSTGATLFMPLYWRIWRTPMPISDNLMTRGAALADP
jgi:hypothetical protein